MPFFIICPATDLKMIHVNKGISFPLLASSCKFKSIHFAMILQRINGFEFMQNLLCQVEFIGSSSYQMSPSYTSLNQISWIVPVFCSRYARSSR